jgi:hypothetical protein
MFLGKNFEPPIYANERQYFLFAFVSAHSRLTLLVTVVHLGKYYAISRAKDKGLTPKNQLHYFQKRKFPS